MLVRRDIEDDPLDSAALALSFSLQVPSRVCLSSVCCVTQPGHSLPAVLLFLYYDSDIT